MRPRALVWADGGFSAEARADAQRVYDHLGLSCAVEVRVESMWAELGYTQPEEDYYRVAVMFRLDEARTREVLAHELRHVWQLESGRLQAVGDPQVKSWVRWAPNPWLRFWHEVPYEARPWERDAADFARGWVRDAPAGPAGPPSPPRARWLLLLTTALACAAQPRPLPDSLARALVEWSAGPCGAEPPVPVRVRWNFPGDPWPWGPDALAATETRRRAGRVVAINVQVRADVDWSRFSLDAAVRHEVGHALGLPHSRGGLMADYLPPGANPPVSASDRAALCPPRGGGD